MPDITLLDGQIKKFDQPLTPLDIAQNISPSLAKKMLAAKVNGCMVDASTLITQDAQVTFVTPDQIDDALEVTRHSTAHLLAQAVKQLYPETQVTIGPVIQDGFYYDFAREAPFTPDDLACIEKRMVELAQANTPIQRRELSRDAAIAHFLELGETYKAQIIRDLPETEALSLYKQGDFEDLCRGPHVPSTGHLKAFKLLKLAGAYWRGNSENAMLQRIYGTAWLDKKSLEAYLHRIEEAEKRDHRKLGKALDLFHFQDIAAGMVFWHPKGWAIYRVLEEYMRSQLQKDGYQEIKTPQLVDVSLWEKSGHLANFRENMFITETESREYAVKPMSCPCHVQVYNDTLRSYRELPLRLSEFGNCHRCEPSGALHGLMRVRNMVQDDGHIFCTEEDIQAEVVCLLDLVQSVYKDFGFTDILYRLALRPEKRVGSDAVWDAAEHGLRAAMQSRGVVWQDAPGEGAFYGPKIECSLSDSLGRIWQCGTIQIDFSMPQRLDATYVASDGSRKVPVMIHRAILGSFERFIGILIEHYAGKFPLWLSPVQAILLTITEKHNNFASDVAKTLKKNGFRVDCDLRNEKIGFKIREHTMQKIPYLIIVGDKEMDSNTVSVRSREGVDLGALAIPDFIELLERVQRTKEH
ncbi:MAG: threonine--tRNA ligase [Legionellaceae bacterium]|nr:threonine--tRNA ligase [Legionellaceae bacterium]